MLGYEKVLRKATPPPSPTVMVLPKQGRRKLTSRVKTLDPRVHNEITTPVRARASVLPQTHFDMMVLSEYRRGLRACDEGYCTCACNCHTGNECTEAQPRIHTPGHKPQYVTVQRDALCKCPQEGTRHPHILYCRDAITDTKFHERQPNTAHKGAHRECPKEGREHNRK